MSFVSLQPPAHPSRAAPPVTLPRVPNPPRPGRLPPRARATARRNGRPRPPPRSRGTASDRRSSLTPLRRASTDLLRPGTPTPPRPLARPSRRRRTTHSRPRPGLLPPPAPRRLPPPPALATLRRSLRRSGTARARPTRSWTTSSAGLSRSRGRSSTQGCCARSARPLAPCTVFARLFRPRSREADTRSHLSSFPRGGTWECVDTKTELQSCGGCSAFLRLFVRACPRV